MSVKCNYRTKFGDKIKFDWLMYFMPILGTVWMDVINKRNMSYERP